MNSCFVYRELVLSDIIPVRVNVINRSAWREIELHRPSGDDRKQTHINEVAASRIAGDQRSEASAKRLSVYYKLKSTTHVARRVVVPVCTVLVQYHNLKLFRAVIQSVVLRISATGESAKLLWCI